MKKTFSVRPINAISDFTSQVDIVIPFHGQYHKVSELLDSIFKNTRSNYYKIYLVDDASPNVQFLRNVESNVSKSTRKGKNESALLTGIQLEKQQGFAGALKAGFLRGESPYVCFLNSDSLIEDPDWLKNLGETLLELKQENVRLVSPMTNNPVGGYHAQEGKRGDKDDKHIILEDGEHLSFYCFMCHRELFSHCDGFLKEYPYGYYEDEEFAARMNKYGFKQAVCKKSWIYHEGASTIKTLWRQNVNIRKTMIEENRIRCLEDMKKL